MLSDDIGRGQYRSGCPHMCFKIGVVKNITNLIGKNLCWSLFLIKLQALRPATLLTTQVFRYEIYEIFKNTFFS